MSGLALVARSLGAEVTGSDRSPDSPYLAPLRALGVEPSEGHDAAHVPDGRRGGRLQRDPAGEPGARHGPGAASASCTAPTCSAS